MSHKMDTMPKLSDKSAQLKIIFLISQPKHMLWVLKRTVLLSSQNTCSDWWLRKRSHFKIKSLQNWTSHFDASFEYFPHLDASFEYFPRLDTSVSFEYFPHLDISFEYFPHLDVSFEYFSHLDASFEYFPLSTAHLAICFTKLLNFPWAVWSFSKLLWVYKVLSQTAGILYALYYYLTIWCSNYKVMFYIWHLFKHIHCLFTYTQCTLLVHYMALQISII